MDPYFSAGPTIEPHVMALEEIIKKTGETPEGNSFYYHESFVRCDEQIFKRANLFWAGSQCKRRLLEIGFNAGHSAMLLLLSALITSATPIDFTVFDLGEHAYFRPCMDYIKKSFPHVNVEVIEGNSRQTVPTYLSSNSHKNGTYDVVHIDGGHDYDTALNDIGHTMDFVAIGGLMVIDDTNIDYIDRMVDGVIKMGSFVEEKKLETYRYKHRILRRIK
jgi:hypothetical protein